MNQQPTLESLHKKICKQQGYIFGLVSLTKAMLSVQSQPQIEAALREFETIAEGMAALNLGADLSDADIWQDGLEEFRSILPSPDAKI